MILYPITKYCFIGISCTTVRDEITGKRKLNKKISIVRRGRSKKKLHVKTLKSALQEIMAIDPFSPWLPIGPRTDGRSWAIDWDGWEIEDPKDILDTRTDKEPKLYKCPDELRAMLEEMHEHGKRACKPLQDKLEKYESRMSELRRDEARARRTFLFGIFCIGATASTWIFQILM